MNSENNKGYTHLRALLEAFNQGTEVVLNLYNPDAIVEYPYATSMGLPSRLTMEDYKEHLDRMLGNMPDISFTDLRVYALQDPESYWAEVHGETRVSGSNALYQQDYVIFFTLRNGKFSQYKEYWNILPVLKSLLSEEEARTILSNNHEGN